MDASATSLTLLVMRYFPEVIPACMSWDETSSTGLTPAAMPSYLALEFSTPITLQPASIAAIANGNPTYP